MINIINVYKFLAEKNDSNIQNPSILAARSTKVR